MGRLERFVITVVALAAIGGLLVGFLIGLWVSG